MIVDVALRHAVPTEYSVPVVAVAVAGQRLLAFSGRMTALFLALLASFRAATRSRLELAGRDSRTPASACGAAPRNTETTAPPSDRSAALGAALDRLATMAAGREIVTPATVLRCHRRAFAAYWRWNSRPCPSRIRCQAATGSWTRSRQWETQRTWLRSAGATVCPPAKVSGVWPSNDAWQRAAL